MTAEEKVARLEAELERTRELAASYKEELDSFVYAASHDLKQPMRSIGSYTQLLIRSLPKDKETEEFAHFIMDGVKSATNVIDQLLNFSRSGTATSRTWLPLSAAVQAAMYKLNDQITRTKAQVLYTDLPELSVNQGDMEKLFENLIDNSLKYRGSAAPVVEITAEETGDTYTISVRDNGPGIAPEYRQQVLKPFKRLHDNRIPGSGLGLAVCKKIVQNHGGRLWVDGDERGGTIVRFTLPV